VHGTIPLFVRPGTLATENRYATVYFDRKAFIEFHLKPGQDLLSAAKLATE
jgi:hypothetical protein